MNDPLTFAATDDEDRHEIPDITAPGPKPVRTLLDTAATCRPLEEVTALVSLLKDNGRQPNPGHEALRTAAVARPVHEVRRMVALLGEPPHEVAEADITLRAAALGRPIEEVAQLVSILGAEESGQPEDSGDAEPEERAGAAAPAPPAAPQKESHGRQPEEPYTSHEPPYREPYAAPYEKPRGRNTRGTGPEGRPAGSGSPALRHVLRWPVAVALLVSGALHLPKELAALPSAAPEDLLPLLPLLATVLCLGLGAVLVLRDTAVVWRAAAATAVGVVVLHVVGGVAGFDPLAGAVGGSLAWAGVLAVLCAAAAAVLAGLALSNRQESPA
ncbi:hypothetical protein [Streptomyces sp. NPDC048269]|uniref:hypothetical protein n=1 Tax=Streptomyces sp. NPDC048269 TaxID=3155753 RepID=UPI00341E8169